MDDLDILEFFKKLSFCTKITMKNLFGSKMKYLCLKWHSYLNFDYSNTAIQPSYNKVSMQFTQIWKLTKDDGGRNDPLLVGKRAYLALLSCNSIRLARTPLEGWVTKAVGNTAVAVRDTHFTQETVHQDGRRGHDHVVNGVPGWFDHNTIILIAYWD